MENSSSSTNVSLLIRVKDPENHDAWSHFDAKYRPMIVRFCRARFSLSAEAAEESAQVVLVKLLKNMRDFEYDPKQSFRAWLTRVTRNSVIDGMRKARPDQAAGGSDMMVRLHNISREDQTSHDDLAKQLSYELRKALFDECEDLVRSRVEEHTWNIFTMLREGKKAAEVSKMTGMSVPAIYQSKTRVLKLFREEVTMRLKTKE